MKSTFQYISDLTLQQYVRTLHQKCRPVVHELFKKTKKNKETSKTLLQVYMRRWPEVRKAMEADAKEFRTDLLGLTVLWFFNDHKASPVMNGDELKKHNERYDQRISEVVQLLGRESKADVSLDKSPEVAQKSQMRAITLMMMAVSDHALFVMRNSFMGKASLFSHVIFLNLNWPPGVKYDIVQDALDSVFGSYQAMADSIGQSEQLNFFPAESGTTRISAMFEQLEKVKKVHFEE